MFLHLNSNDALTQTFKWCILEQLSRPRFSPGFEISRSFVRAKQVEKGREFQNPEKSWS